MGIARPQLRELHRPHAPQAVQLLIVGGADRGGVGKALRQPDGELGRAHREARPRRPLVRGGAVGSQDLIDAGPADAEAGGDRLDRPSVRAQGADLRDAGRPLVLAHGAGTSGGPMWARNATILGRSSFASGEVVEARTARLGVAQNPARVIWRGASARSWAVKPKAWTPGSLRWTPPTPRSAVLLGGAGRSFHR